MYVWVCSGFVEQGKKSKTADSLYSALELESHMLSQGHHSLAVGNDNFGAHRCARFGEHGMAAMKFR